MKNSKASMISDAAIVVALTVVLMVIAMYVPFFGLLSVFVSGIPLAYLVIKRGLGISITAFAASILVMFIIMGDLLGAAVLSVVTLLPGLVVGYTIWKNFRFTHILLAAAVSALFGMMLQLMLINALTADGHGLEEILNSSLEMIKGILQSASENVKSLYADNQTDFSTMINTVIEAARATVTMYFPSFILIGSAIVGYGVTIVAVFVLKRLRVRSVPYIPFYRIKAPKSMCYTAVGIFLLTMFTSNESVFTAALNNVVFILYAYIAVCGLSLLDYKFREKLSSGYKRAMVYVAVGIVGYILISFVVDILIIVGMIDGVLDFRRIKAGDGRGEGE